MGFASGVHAGIALGKTVQEGWDRADAQETEGFMEETRKKEAAYHENARKQANDLGVPVGDIYKNDLKGGSQQGDMQADQGEQPTGEQPNNADAGLSSNKPAEDQGPTVTAIDPNAGDTDTQNTVGMQEVSGKQYKTDSAAEGTPAATPMKMNAEPMVEEAPANGTGTPMNKERGGEESGKGEQPPAEMLIAKDFLTNPAYGTADYQNASARIWREASAKYGKPEMYEQWKAHAETGFALKKSGVTDSLPSYLLGDMNAGDTRLRSAGHPITGPSSWAKNGGEKNRILSMEINGERRDVPLKTIIEAANPKKFIENEYKKGEVSGKDLALTEKYKEQTKTEKTKQGANKALESLRKATELAKTSGGPDAKKLPPAAKMAEWWTDAPQKHKDSFAELQALKGKDRTDAITKMVLDLQKDGMTPEEADAMVRVALNMGKRINAGKPPAKEEAPKGKGKLRFNEETGEVDTIE